jgi:DNA-binding LytR/AlgR family response regulator
MKLNCLIIDDEPIARKGIAEYVKEVDFLHLIAQCENPLKVASELKRHTIDLIYLDIQMPKLSGIEFLKSLPNPPLTIITTAHPGYALEGYTLDIVDYLVKPIPFERFLRASQKAKEISRLKRMTDGSAMERDYFFVKSNNKYEKLFFSDVRFIEALQNYVVIHTNNRKLITYLTMSAMEQQLPLTHFLKVHKSYIIGMYHVKALDGNDVVIDDVRIPISRNLKEEVTKRIMGDRLLKR